MDLGGGMDLKSCIGLVCGEGNGRNQLWVAKMLLHWRAYAGKDNIEDELAFTQYVAFSQLVHEIDQTPICVCSRWRSDDKMDHTLDHCLFCKKRKNEGVEEWFRLKPSTSF